MQKTRIPSHWFLVPLGLALAGPVKAMGLGAGPAAVILGQALDFSVALRLDPGETLDPECVRAKVSLGDRQLASDAVAATLVESPGGGKAIRVRTAQRIDEPVVSVQVEAGCSVRLLRRYVVFADPPTMVAAAPMLPQPTEPAAAAATPAPSAAAPPPSPSPAEQARVAAAAAPAPGATPTAPSASAAPVAAPALPPRPAAPPRAAAPRPPAPAAPVPAPAPEADAPDAPDAPEAALPAPAPQAAAPAPRPAPRPAARQAPPANAEAPAPRPRLRLDAAPTVTAVAAAPAAAAEPELSPEALALVDQANEAVKAALAAASASQGRIAALEESVRTLSAQAATQQESLALLRERALAAEQRSGWMMPLALATLALLALAVWLWLRLRELERDRQRSWLAAAQGGGRAAVAPDIPPSPSKVPLLVERSVRSAGSAALGAGMAPQHEPTPSELPDPPVPDPARSPTPARAPAAAHAVPSSLGSEPPEPPTVRTQVLVNAQPPAPEARDVSAEELIDLEQQAEFFIVLGQDDAAIDLLVSHLRDAGGSSPLPYLKLLEIYRRLDDREAYERTRDRFNHRFNAHVPGWEAPAGEGRSLEDYPNVLGWIQHVWPKPLDAMAELESLLFRKDGGDLFDLPAYREVMFLYSLARDLVDGGAAGSGVDVLLPLSGAADFDNTSPKAYFGPETGDGARAGARSRSAEAGPNTAPVGLDLDLDLPGDASGGRFDRSR